MVVVTGVGLIAWRGDRLRSPGGIDSPLSREGAFLVNNLLFVRFAFVVLLGTVFPLLYEALTRPAGHGRAPPTSTGMTVPVGLGAALPDGGGAGPALAEVVGRGRCAAAWPCPPRSAWRWWWPASSAGVRGIEPLLAFGLGAFAAASAVRALVLSVAGLAHRPRGRRAPAGRRLAAGAASSAGPTGAWSSTSGWWSSPSV